MARLFDDASTEYLRATSSPVSGEPFALCSWFNSNDATIAQGVLSVGDVSGASYHYLTLRGNEAGDYIQARSFDGGSSFGTTSTGYTVNVWHHGAAIFVAANDRRCLIDGGSKGTSPVSRTVTTTAVAIGISADSTPFGPFSGSIAEAGIWDLSGWPGATASDKADAFEAIAVPSLAKGYSPILFMLGLVSYWPLIRDEDQDRVGGFDLTAFNTPGVAEHPPIIYPSFPQATSALPILLRRVFITHT